jgi:hypothetical protein
VTPSQLYLRTYYYNIVTQADQSLNCRIRNKAKLKAADLVNPANTELRDLLQKAEYVLQNQGDFIDAEEEEDEGPTGSNSDSDFDEEPTNGKKR